jgi:uncharacterized protein (TIGR02300 family)
MARDLGVRYVCFNCGGKFYDLHRPEPICPKCGADQRQAPKPQPMTAAARRAKEKEEAEEIGEIDSSLSGGEDEDEPLEDDADEAIEAEEV